MRIPDKWLLICRNFLANRLVYGVECDSVPRCICGQQHSGDESRLKRKLVSGKSDNNSGCLYSKDRRLTIHIEVRILERVGHICSMGGSTTRKANAKRVKCVVLDKQES